MVAIFACCVHRFPEVCVCVSVCMGMACVVCQLGPLKAGDPSGAEVGVWLGVTTRCSFVIFEMLTCHVLAESIKSRVNTSWSHVIGETS